MIRESIAKLVDGRALTHDEAHATLRERLRPTSVAYVLTKPGAAPSVSR